MQNPVRGFLHGDAAVASVFHFLAVALYAIPAATV
jgi:hypothetical protein